MRRCSATDFLLDIAIHVKCSVDYPNKLIFQAVKKIAAARSPTAAIFFTARARLFRRFSQKQKLPPALDCARPMLTVWKHAQGYL